ncbi:dihydrolipoamide acetyltransferase family protein [Nocardioides sp. L-11A]|uniref:dihydrolipoamide acetyltransferase family protein n=1 Tax=Nocardioides sp. L-11A TaxID=3043848 RepID=UPI002499DB49|nr:dihydrolipoamide acetyltransferase family protein [Nocardioides sp. L-11A]
MAELLRMPEVLANSTEAVLAGWLVEPGVAFVAGDPIATVETEKAIVDVEADRDGCLLDLLVAPGTSVRVGTPIAVVGVPGESLPDPTTLGLTPEQSAPEQPAPEQSVREPVPEGRRVFASPLARRLAAEHGLRLEELSGSGPRGRIRRRDVDAALARGRSEPAEPAAPSRPTDPAAYHDEPHTPLRRAISRRLSASKQEVPHFYLRASCRVARLTALRADLNRYAEPRVSLNDLLVKAVARTHTLVPDLNVMWTEEALRRFASVDVAVAIASGRGLVTPVLRGVEARSVAEIGALVRDLRERADAGTLRQHELEGGSVSVSNLGGYGTEEFAAIINPPQAAILAIGAVRDEVIAEDGAPQVAPVLRVTLSVDHRAADGAAAARWLAAFVAVVEDPIQLLT